MVHHLKNILCKNIILKISALCIGYCIWHTFSSARMISLWLTVPIAFYGMSEQCTIDAPETLDVLIAGKRLDLCNLDISTLCAHININDYKTGINHIPITAELLFLPESIKLVHYYPLYIDIHVHNMKQQAEESTE